MIEAPPKFPRARHARRYAPLALTAILLIIAGGLFRPEPKHPGLSSSSPTPVFNSDLRRAWRTVELPGTDEAVAAVRTDALYVATATGTWWRLAKGAGLWKLVSHEDPAFQMAQITSATALGDDIVAAGYSFTNEHPSFPAIWRSNDATRWTSENLSPADGHVTEVASDQTDLVAVGLLVEGGATTWKSAGDAAWENGVFEDGAAPRDLLDVVKGPEAWYSAGTTAAGTPGVWRSVDGVHWELDGFDTAGSMISLDVDDRGTLVALSQPTALWQRLATNSWVRHDVPDATVPFSGIEHTSQGWVVYGESGITDDNRGDQAMVSRDLGEWDSFLWPGRVEHLTEDLVALGSVGAQPAVWTWPAERIRTQRVHPESAEWSKTGLPDVARQARFLATGAEAAAIFGDELFIAATGGSFRPTGIHQDVSGGLVVAGETYLYDSSRIYRMSGGIRPSPAAAPFAISAVRHIGGEFVAVGTAPEAGVVGHSTDGVGWHVQDVTRPGGQVSTSREAFIVVGPDSVHYSTEGRTWNTAEIPGGGSPWQLTPDVFALVYPHWIMVTENGSEWRRVNNPVGRLPAAFWSGGGRWLLAAEGRLWSGGPDQVWKPVSFGRSFQSWYPLVGGIPDRDQVLLAANDHGRPVILEWLAS